MAGCHRVPASASTPGYVEGDTVPGAFDSLLAKLIVTGATRHEAIERSRRALAEFEVGGMPTIIPFHRAVLDDADFTDEPFRVHTRWIETEWTGSVEPYDGSTDGRCTRPERERITVEVGGRRLEVSLPGGLAATRSAGGRGRPQAAVRTQGSVVGRGARAVTR